MHPGITIEAVTLEGLDQRLVIQITMGRRCGRRHG
jgi:hypothetical protein